MIAPETLFFVLVILAFFAVGVFLIVGTFKGMRLLIDPPVEWYSTYPYWYLKNLGSKAPSIFHIFIGIVFILGAIWLVMYGFF
jgi:hypothetical protein